VGRTLAGRTDFSAHFPANNSGAIIRTGPLLPKMPLENYAPRGFNASGVLGAIWAEKLGEDLARNHIADGEEGDNTT